MFTPEYAVISVGERNRYHHPSKEVLDRLDRHGVEYICTKDKGMVRIKVKDSGYKFFVYRDK
jgi:competence protein ComEC